MDQQTPGAAPSELPRPQLGGESARMIEQVGLPVPENIAAKALEIAPVTAQGPSSQPLVPLQSTVGLSQPAVQQTTTPASAATNPSIADDADLIEKEWVMKAKDIVNQTKDDPHRQNQEMNHFKADYQKKRYNRDVKVSQE